MVFSVTSNLPQNPLGTSAENGLVENRQLGSENRLKNRRTCYARRLSQLDENVENLIQGVSRRSFRH